MERDFSKKLLAWKESKRRKPLLVTGVRQCGKTYLLKKFGAEYFAKTCYINFEAKSAYSAIFEYDFDVKRIVKELEFLEQCQITAGETLLIFDEIQEAPRAITALKYFCEELPTLHLVCAGSLLGVALKKENISFPVGKVNMMQMYPMSFREFLAACGEERYIELFSDWAPDRELPPVFSQPLEHLLKEYYLVGGMPEVVQEYVNSKNFALVQEIQQEILFAYGADFSKHAPLSELEKIRLVWDSIPKQLAKENNKFIFSHVKEGKRAHELEGALEWLKNAGLIYLIELVQNAEIPLAAYADATYFKVYMADPGLLSRRLMLDYKDFFAETPGLKTFKGAVVENYVLNELIQLGKTPYFWRSGNSAELDFLYEEEGQIVPVEVKAATNTQAKSYKEFCKKYKPVRGYKLSLKNIAESDCLGTQTISLPLYLAWKM